MLTQPVRLEPEALALALASSKAGSAETASMFAEKLLTRVCTSEPWLAEIVANSVRTLGPEGAEFARALLDRVGDGVGVESLQPRLSVDVLLLVVKSVELGAALRAFGVPEGVAPARKLGDEQVWMVEHGGVRIAIALIGTAGNVESAIRLGALLSVIRFKLAALVGMAAGVLGEIRLGDVVVAEQVLAYEFQTMTKSGPIYAPVPYKCSPSILRSLRTYEQQLPLWGARAKTEMISSDGYHAIPEEDLDDRKDDWVPKVSFGNILAGAKLIEDGSLPKLRKKLNERTRAAEMEGAGFAAACEEAKVPWLVLRGIADYGQPKRKKNWQHSSTYLAAAFLRDCLGGGLLQAWVGPQE